MLCQCVLTADGKALLFWPPEEQLMMDQLLGTMLTESS